MIGLFGRELILAPCGTSRNDMYTSGQFKGYLIPRCKCGVVHWKKEDGQWVMVSGQCPRIPFTGDYAPGHYQRTEKARRHMKFLRKNKLRVVNIKLLVPRVKN